MLTLAIEPLSLQDAVATPEPRAAAGFRTDKAASETDVTSSEEQVGRPNHTACPTS